MLSFVWATIRFTCVVLMHKLYILYYGLFVVRGVPLVQLIAHDLQSSAAPSSTAMCAICF
jgi:hypothetical protein